MKRLHIAALVVGLCALPSWGEVWFSELDLSSDNRLLFRAENGVWRGRVVLDV